LTAAAIESRQRAWALGLLSGIAFAAIYSTLGIPIALLADRGSRKTIVSLSLFVWSAMTALCGLATARAHSGSTRSASRSVARSASSQAAGSTSGSTGGLPSWWWGSLVSRSRWSRS
jgi:hypothetical protein